jgi:two-component system sensor histidine kinase TctE
MKRDDATSVAVEAPQSQRSLFGEILDWMLAPLLLIWPISVAVTYFAAQSIANAPFDRELETSVRVLAQQLHVSGPRVTFDLPIEARELLRTDQVDTVYYQVWDTRGELVSGDSELALPSDEDEPLAGSVVGFRDDQVRGVEVRVAWMTVDYPGLARRTPKYRPAIVQVAETLEKRSQLASEIIKGLILPQFLILPVAVVLVWGGLSRGIQPLKLLQLKLRNRTPEDLSPIDPREAPEEVSPLVVAFNEMLARLAASIASQRRFIADAAHQMKTPLAGLRTQAEIALREDNPAEVQRSLRQIATASERATHLINQLLALARAENQGEQNPMMEILDLCSLAREAVGGFFDRAVERGIDLGFEEPDTALLVNGNRTLLNEMIKNLVDNALRYSPAGSDVTVRVSWDAVIQRARLDVEDTGPGIPETERPLVFERFYRVLGTGQDGSGLGLAIVREIAQQHDARLSVGENPRSKDAPGCLISLTFERMRVQAALDD